MEKLHVVTKDNEGRRSNAYLRHIIHLKPSSLITRRLNSHSCLAKHIIEHTGRNSRICLTVNILYVLIDIPYSLSCFSGYKEYWCIRHICKSSIYTSRKFIYRTVILFNGIPFVNNNNGCLSDFMCYTSDFLILLSNSFICINKDKTYVCSLHRHMRAKNTVFFDLVIDL